jgi:hypothetical protein
MTYDSETATQKCAIFADARDQIEASGVSDDELDDRIEASVAKVRARRRE